jgi:hypothetical protein
MSDTIAVETARGPARFRFPLDDGGRIAVEHDGSIHTEWFLYDGDSAWAVAVLGRHAGVVTCSRVARNVGG